MTYEEERAELMSKAEEAMAVNNVQLANDYMNKVDKLDEKHKEMAEAEKRLEEAKRAETAEAEAKKEAEILASVNEASMEEPQNIDLNTVTENTNLVEKETINMSENKMTKDTLVMTREYHDAYWANIMHRATQDQLNMLTTASTSAGAAVPQITIDRIEEVLTKMAGVISQADIMNVPGLVSVPYESTMNDAALHTELNAISDAGDVVSALPMPTYELTKLLSLSGNLEETSIASFEDWVESNLYRSILYRADKYAILGTGSSQPAGLASLTFTAGTNGVALSADLAYDDLATAVGLLPSYYDNSAVWMMSKKTYWTTVRGLALGDTKDSVVNDRMLLGYPVVFDDFVTDDVIFFGSIREGLKINIPGSIKVEQGRYLRANAYDFLGSANFACNVIPNAFVKIAATL